MKTKTSIQFSLVNIIFTIFTIFFFRPTIVFLRNVNEFSVSYISVFPLIIIITILFFCISFLLISFFLYADFCNALYFGIGIAVFIQGYFLNPNFEVLNGREIEWENYSINAVISTFVWIFCIVFPFICVLNIKLFTIYKRLELFTCYILFAIQVLFVIFLGITGKKTNESNYVLTENDEFLFSKYRNTVVFVIDTLDGQWLDDFILSDAGFVSYLKDFTYFDNAVAGGSPTILGIPLMLTGEMYDTNVSLNTYYLQAYEKSTLLKDLSDENIKIKLYTNTEYLYGADYSLLDNASNESKHYISEKIKFTKILYKLVAFIEAPQLMKSRFWIYGDVLSNYISLKHKYSTEYVVDFNDPRFYENFKKSYITLGYKQPAFILYHLFGCHGPYNMNENAELVPAESTSRIQSTKGAFKICFDIIEAMKVKGVYDSSTIIITADHGGRDVYQNPAILCKMPSENKDSLTINSCPVTFKNLYNTFAKSMLVKHKNAYGDTLFEVKNTIAERLHVAPHVLGVVHFPDNEYVNRKNYATYIIPSNVRNFSELKVLAQAENHAMLCVSRVDVKNNTGYQIADESKSGFYGFESESVWVKQKAFVILKNRNVSKIGLSFFIIIPEQVTGLYPELRIYINNLLYKKMNTSPGKLELYFPADEISSFDDIYEIRIEHDFSFVPKEQGINEDTRELSLQVFYIGEKR